jgi:thiosulfate/3-mercaptopyruvate sulfurtransferase
VLYGGNNNWFAAYAYWYFKLYGHGDVRLLDGGRKKWELDGRELVSDVPSRTATQYVAKDQDRSIRAFRDDVLKAIGTQNLVDVRSPDEYAGRLLRQHTCRKKLRALVVTFQQQRTSHGVRLLMKMVRSSQSTN